jgi:hypothetical protein
MDVRVGMPVKSGDGDSMGKVAAVDRDGIVLEGGLVASWNEVIEVRDGALWLAAHRPALEELAEKGT